jgi:hypothetical protein
VPQRLCSSNCCSTQCWLCCVVAHQVVVRLSLKPLVSDKHIVTSGLLHAVTQPAARQTSPRSDQQIRSVGYNLVSSNTIDISLYQQPKEILTMIIYMYVIISHVLAK